MPWWWPPVPNPSSACMTATNTPSRTSATTSFRDPCQLATSHLGRSIARPWEQSADSNRQVRSDRQDDMGQEDGGGIALLFLFCGLDAIGRAPGGELVAGGVGVHHVFWRTHRIHRLGQHDQLDYSAPPSPPAPLPPYAVYLYPSPPPPTAYANAKVEPHTPNDTSTETSWTNFILLFIFVTLLTSPACWYVPRYYYSGRRVAPSPPVVQSVPVAESNVTTAATQATDQRPLLALHASGVAGA